MSALPAAVLWDMDGTLVDTEPYWIECEFALVAAHGDVWTMEDAHSLVGQDLLFSARLLRERGGVRLAEADIVALLVSQVAAMAREHLPWRPGAQQLLADLAAADVPCALVTMSYPELADAVVTALPAGTFRAVVTGDTVANGKPHPEAYLTAATLLDVAPRDCVAIEDSTAGVASAEAAGVPVIAVVHYVPLAPGPGRRVLTTLEGVSPQDLGRWSAELVRPSDVAEL